MNKKKRVRISDIAEAVGVSTATVSRALSGEGYVSEDLAAKIRSAALDMNYQLPQNLVNQKVLLAASHDAMVDFQRNQFTTYVLQGLHERAKSLNIEVVSYTLQTDNMVDRLQEKAASDNFIGVLLLTVDDVLQDIAQAIACPVVLINGDDPDMHLSSVTPCNRSAAALATKHLRNLGHKKILFLTKSGRRTIKRRKEGWQDATQDKLDASYVIEVDDWTALSGQKAIEDAIDRKMNFSAIVAAADVLAAGALLGLAAKGRRVPEDTSVIGIDGLPQGEFLSPPLTSVAIPMQDVGASSLDLICEIVKYAEAKITMPVKRIELACRLTTRASTGAVKVL